ncbi:MAG: hypothetical protein KTR14_11605 [Vampirovibrio sp.]|nr:hypothetical protein [Vampirovibrio sp.]
MSSPTNIKASERDTTLNPRQLRAAGFVPATLYGKNQEPKAIQVKTYDFVQLYAKGARVFQLDGLSPVVTAIAHNVQMDAVPQKVLSIEFLVPSSQEQLDAAFMKKAAAPAEPIESPAQRAPEKPAEAPEVANTEEAAEPEAVLSAG